MIFTFLKGCKEEKEGENEEYSAKLLHDMQKRNIC